MSIERVTAERALEHLRAGHSIIILHPADMTSLTIADWLMEDLAIEVPDEMEPKNPPPRSVKIPNRQLLVLKRSWIMERSRHYIMQDGLMRKLPMRWDVHRGQWQPCCQN